MNVASTEEMSPELALQLFHNGAFFVLKDAPPGLEFGIDYKSWTVGEKFLGVKMIPPGIHFIYCGVCNAPRNGFFHNFEPHEIFIRRWDKLAENFSNWMPAEEEVDRLRANLRSVDSNLGAYPYSTYRQWASLTSAITCKTVARLRPANTLGLITAQTEFSTKEQDIERQMGDGLGTSVVNRTHPERIRFSDAEGLPIMTPKPGTLIPFTSIPQVALADTNLKKAGIDSSDRLYKLLDLLGGDYKEILAEFQFAFVVFLIGQVFEGFDQWKRIMHLVCSCQKALLTHTALFTELLMVIFYQIKECPDDFFFDNLAKNNFLASTLSLLFANIEDAPKGKIESLFVTKSVKFKSFLEKKFKRSFSLPKN